MSLRLRCLLIILLPLLLLAPGSAFAAGGHYDIVGGTTAERTQVTAALNASSFDWDVVAEPVTIHVARGVGSYAVPGEIWLDADLLDAGRFAWGVVQHEYAHQVDFFGLTQSDRAELLPLLGGRTWWDSPACALPHAQIAAERFASMLAWSYWQSPDNVMRPQSATDESAAMPPAEFRALLGRMVVLPAARAEGPAQTDFWRVRNVA
jgi:hypothetical protein